METKVHLKTAQWLSSIFICQLFPNSFKIENIVRCVWTVQLRLRLRRRISSNRSLILEILFSLAKFKRMDQRWMPCLNAVNRFTFCSRWDTKICRMKLIQPRATLLGSSTFYSSGSDYNWFGDFLQFACGHHFSNSFTRIVILSMRTIKIGLKKGDHAYLYTRILLFLKNFVCR